MRLTIALVAATSAAFALGGCETVAETVSETYETTMTGAQEVPGPGDPDGTGTAEAHVVDALDRICYEIHDVRNIGAVTAAHIHRGARGVAGPPVVTLELPADGHATDCADIDGTLGDEIKRNPQMFYVNVHTAEYPNGAIRGQLAR